MRGLFKRLLTLDGLAFALAAVAFAVWANPPASEKRRHLYLNRPVESPDGVVFTWANGEAGRTYRIMSRVMGTDEWYPLATRLAPSGMHEFRGFTLDRDHEYRIEAEEP